MDYSVLTNELSLDPENIGYAAHIASGNDEEIARLLNEPDFTLVGTVTSDRFAIWAAGGARAVIEDHANNISSPLRASALTLLDMLRGHIASGLNLGDPMNMMLLNVWAGFGAITTNDYDTLVALATKNVSRFQQLYGVDVRKATTTDVAKAVRDDLGNPLF